MEKYFIYLVAGLLGVIAHCLFKAKDIISDAKRLNVEFTFKDYLKVDWFGVSTSLLSVFIWLLIFGEVGAKYPKIIDYVITSFVAMGFIGSYILQKFFSNGKAYVRGIMDKKSDIADDKVQLFSEEPEGDPIPPSGPKGGKP